MRSLAEKLSELWARFWTLSWWWKGSVLAVIPLLALILALIIVLAVATGDGDDMAALEARQEPTPTAAVATRSPAATPTPAPTPTPTPAPTATPEPPPQQEEPPPQEAEPAPPAQQPPLQLTAMPVGLVTGITVTVQVQVTQPQAGVGTPIQLGIPIGFGDVSTETQCEYEDGGRLKRAITTITVSPDPYWENWEGAPLTYVWSASNGSISGSGLTATLTQLAQSGWIEQGEVTLTVSDGSGASVTPGLGFHHFRECE